MSLFLDSQFHFIDLCVCPYASYYIIIIILAL